MLVLVATNELQGTTPDDYTFTVEGELVTPLASECASGDRCGCARGFPGLASGFATTTAMVVDRPGVTEADLRDAVYDWLDRGGWIDLLEQTADDRTAVLDDDLARSDEIDWIVEGIIDEHLELIRQVCDAYPAGSIIVRHGTMVRTRSYPTAA